MPPYSYLVVGYDPKKDMDELMGLLLDVLEEDGGEIDRCHRAHDKRTLADTYSAERYAGLVILGDTGEPAGNDYADERACVERAINHDWPVLGICHGCQLTAVVRGARIDYKLDPPDEGRRKVFLSTEGEIDPVVSHLTPSVQLWQEHEWAYRFPRKTPDDFVHLACSSHPKTPHSEAFRIGRRVYGVQFHPEVRNTKDCEAGRQLLANWKRLTLRT